MEYCIVIKTVVQFIDAQQMFGKSAIMDISI